jgi:hypothetical protein
VCVFVVCVGVCVCVYGVCVCVYVCLFACEVEILTISDLGPSWVLAQYKNRTR